MSDRGEPVPTPRYQRVVGASSEIARTMGHAHAGVEHLFLAIIKDRDAVPTQVLEKLVDLRQVESLLRDFMGSPGYSGSSRELPDLLDGDENDLP